MHIMIVCKAHMHAKHAKLGGLGACSPENFEKFRLTKIEFESIFDDIFDSPKTGADPGGVDGVASHPP